MSTPHSGSDQDIQRELERTKGEAAHLASSATESVKEQGRESIDRAKEQAAERADEVASALESTAADLESTDDDMAGYGRSMAELMRRFAGGLREQEIEEFAGQLAGYARRNPASFFAGSVALGFGVSRFLKATSARPVEDYGFEDYDEEDEYWLEGEETGLEDDLGAGDGGVTAPGAASAERWPEDTGRERPGAGSSTDHWTPTASPESTQPGSAGVSASPAPGSNETTSGEGIKTPGQNERRNEP